MLKKILHARHLTSSKLKKNPIYVHFQRTNDLKKRAEKVSSPRSGKFFKNWFFKRTCRNDFWSFGEIGQKIIYSLKISLRANKSHHRYFHNCLFLALKKNLEMKCELRENEVFLFHAPSTILGRRWQQQPRTKIEKVVVKNQHTFSVIPTGIPARIV